MMKFFNRFFRKREIECPRCLGKGQVDWNDIKRLKQELYWVPGPCAYCDNKGVVNRDFKSKMDVDTTYLVNNLSGKERAHILDHDEVAIEKAMKFVKDTDKFIEIVEELHFKVGFDSNKIADFFLQNQPVIDENAKSELVRYIEKIIQIKKDSN